MTDQFHDNLSHLAQTLKSQLFTAADVFDRQVDVAATLLRETLSTATWVPAAARPSPPPPPPPPLLLRAGGPGVLGWARENRWALGIAAATGVGVAAWVYGKRRQRGRAAVRRARRAADGGRKEVVVLAGSPHDPIARGLALDLERRGFIVFVVVSSVEDEQVVLNEGRGDVRPLNIDILDPTASQSSIDKFHTYLTTPTASFPGAHPHRLHFTGLLLLPTTPYPTGPIATLPLDHWSDTLNIKLLAPILTTKLLLPTIVATTARIILCTPGLVAPLSPASHAPESAAVAALHAIAASLRRELAPAAVAVTVLRLGTFEAGAAARGALQLARAQRVRAAVVRGSPVRELQLAVVEALLGPYRWEVCVGGGSRAYMLLGGWAPEWLVGWMLAAAAGGAEEAEWERV